MTAALLFDLDGTLLDSDPLHTRVFIDLFAQFGRTIDAAFYMDHIHGRHNVDIFADLLPNEDAEALSRHKEATFRDRLGDRFPPTPGIADLLARAGREGWKTAVVTNAPRINAEAMLAATGLADSFDTLVIGEECVRGKPDPAPYLAALERLGVQADNAIAFEDSPSGIKAARAAGIFTFGMRSGLDCAALRAAGADASLADFNDTALHTRLERLKGTTP